MKLDKQCFIDHYDEDNLIYYEKDLDGKPGKIEFIYNWEYNLQKFTGCGSCGHFLNSIFFGYNIHFKGIAIVYVLAMFVTWILYMYRIIDVPFHKTMLTFSLCLIVAYPVNWLAVILPTWTSLGLWMYYIKSCMDSYFPVAERFPYYENIVKSFVYVGFVLFFVNCIGKLVSNFIRSREEKQGKHYAYYKYLDRIKDAEKESKEIESSDEQEEPYKPWEDKDFFARIAIQDAIENEQIMKCCEEEEIYEDWRDNPKNFPEDQTLFNLNDKIMAPIYNYVGAERPEKATEKQKKRANFIRRTWDARGKTEFYFNNIRNEAHERLIRYAKEEGVQKYGNDVEKIIDEFKRKLFIESVRDSTLQELKYKNPDISQKEIDDFLNSYEKVIKTSKFEELYLKHGKPIHMEL